MCDSDGFELNEKQLSFLISERVSPQHYLWSQIESSAKECRFELCDALLQVWYDKCDTHEVYDAKQAIADLLTPHFDGKHPNNCWYIYQILKKYGLDYALNETEIQMNIILGNAFELSETQTNDMLALSKPHLISSIDDNVLATLKNMITKAPKMAQLLIELFDNSKQFNYMYCQCLIDAIKSNDRNQLLDILSVFPDEEINDKNMKLLEEVCDQFSENDDQIVSLYKCSLLRRTPKLIETLSNLRQLKSKTPLYDIHSQTFNFKECFLLAAHQKKHFINEMLDDENICFYMPPIQRLLFLIYALHKNDLKIDRFIKIEAEIINLLSNCDEISSITGKDSIITPIVKRLHFIINLSNWCTNNLKVNSNSYTRFAIFQALFFGESPLKLLRKYGFLGNKDTINDDITEQISNFLSNFNDNELMIYRGFLAMRYSIMWIILNNDYCNEINLKDKILSLLKSIYPLNFRIEILENIFSLLFLTKNELSESELDDDDYNDESLNKDLFSFSNHSMVLSGTTKTASYTCAPCFLCPNLLAPQILALLKDAIIDTQAAFFKFNYLDTNELPMNISIESSIKDLSEAKVRIDKLFKYVNDAQWRYSVIEPAFNQEITDHERQHSKNDCYNEVEMEDLIDETEFLRSFSSTSGSETERKQSKEIFSSLISCMLASPTQLLRYSLLKGQIERAKQVKQLFEQSLTNTEEDKELKIIENWINLSKNLCSLSTPQKVTNVSKIGEVAADGLRITQIQSVIHEFLFKLEVDDKTKNSLVLDFALTSSPSIETTKIILETILQNNNVSEILPEKVNTLIRKVRTMIIDLSKDYDMKKLSFSKLLTHYSQNENFCDAHSFREEKLTREKICLSYEMLRNHLYELEIKNDDNSPKSSINYSADSKKTTVLFEKLLRVCPVGKFNYLKALFYYVRKVSKALHECRKRSNSSTLSFMESSYFSILNQSPSAILCSMVLKDNISPKFVDDFAREMKVDLIGTLCSVLCPTIPSHYLNECPAELFLIDSCHPALCKLIEVYLRGAKESNSDLNSLMIQNHFDDEVDSSQGYSDDKIKSYDLVNYFKSRSPILVELMKHLNLIKEEDLVSDYSFKANSPLVKWVEIVKEKFSTTSVDITSITSLAFSPRILAGHSAVIKALENYALKGNLLEIYEIFKYIDETLCFSIPNPSYKTLKNAVLSRLAIEQEDMKYALQILESPQTKYDLLIELIDTSKTFEDADIALRNIKSCLASFKYEFSSSNQDLISLEEKLTQKSKEIEFYVTIGRLSGLRLWTDAQQNLSAIDILTIIKTKRKYSLAIDWFNIKGWETESADLQYELLILAYCESNNVSALIKTLSSLDENFLHFLTIIGKVLNIIEDFKFRRFIVEHILEHYSTRLIEFQFEFYTNYLIGVKIIETLSASIRPHYANLITKPILMLEQMLMNIEVESLEKVSQLKIINFDFLIEKYAQKAVEIQIYDIPSNATSVISDLTILSSTICQTPYTLNKFVMPANIPTKDQWIPDSKISHCMLCKSEQFSMINRRHHCRRCGRVICGNCSQNTLTIKEINSNVSVRVCDDCYIQTQLNNRKDSSLNNSAINKNTQSVWFLTCDDMHNDSVRIEFYYESSPSVSLCLTLLKLHTDNNRCCKVIVDLICKPLLETVVSSQVDYGLVIGMIRSLLVSTKVSMDEEKYEHHLDKELKDQLDLLLGRLDAIRMLINANCNTKEFISYALSNNDNSILKLQEKLIEMERFELARDLAMKFGLDLKSIWKTWAFICLKYGRFNEARDKFKQCLDINKTSEGNRILEDIVNLLMKQKNVSKTSLREKCAQIRDGKFNFSDPVIPKTNDSNISMNMNIYNEIMYYLVEYGHKEDIIRFHAKHSMWKQAIHFFLTDSSCLSNYNIFIKDIFMSAAKKGSLSSFLRILRAADPALNRVWKCLLAVCKYLNNNCMFNMLHVVQVFMGDYLRAAITQINCFYLKPEASDYMDLYGRIKYLQQAIQHCRDYLSLDVSKYNSGCLIMDKADVMKQIRAINLQIDITVKFNEKGIKGFLHFDASSGDGVVKINRNPPTILDHSKSRKTELAALVTICCGSSIAEGFSLTQQIIKDHNLDSAQVYRLAGRGIVQWHPIKAIESVSQLLDCIHASPQSTTHTCDDVIGACIRSCSNPALIEPLIKLLSSDINKIDAYILSGKLKSAYLLAVNLNRGTDVTRVLEAAERTDQQQIKKICEMWLSLRLNAS